MLLRLLICFLVIGFFPLISHSSSLPVEFPESGDCSGPLKIKIRLINPDSLRVESDAFSEHFEIAIGQHIADIVRLDSMSLSSPRFRELEREEAWSRISNESQLLIFNTHLLQALQKPQRILGFSELFRNVLEAQRFDSFSWKKLKGPILWPRNQILLSRQLQSSFIPLGIENAWLHGLQTELVEIAALLLPESDLRAIDFVFSEDPFSPVNRELIRSRSRPLTSFAKSQWSEWPTTRSLRPHFQLLGMDERRILLNELLIEFFDRLDFSTVPRPIGPSGVLGIDVERSHRRLWDLLLVLVPLVRSVEIPGVEGRLLGSRLRQLISRQIPRIRARSFSDFDAVMTGFYEFLPAAEFSEIEALAKYPD